MNVLNSNNNSGNIICNNKDDKDDK